MRELKPECPEASTVSRPGRSSGIVCGVVQKDRAREDGIGLDAAATAEARFSEDGVVVWEDSDPSTVHGLCCGRGVPGLAEEDLADHYTACPIWQLAKEARWAGREDVFDQPEPEPYATDDDGNYVDPYQDDFTFGGEEPDVLDPAAVS